MARNDSKTNNQHQPLRARIPCKVVLPFGYIIRVKQLTDGQMNALDRGCDGLWNVDNKTIYIRKSLTLSRRRYILTHELGHAWLDFTHKFLDDGKATTE
jgi:Zn-dependent peptidase ImmA (M78 family)